MDNTLANANSIEPPVINKSMNSVLDEIMEGSNVIESRASDICRLLSGDRNHLKRTAEEQLRQQEPSENGIIEELELLNKRLKCTGEILCRTIAMIG